MMKSKERNQATRQLTDYIKFLQNTYRDMLAKIDEFDVMSDNYTEVVEDEILLTFDMLTACCDEEVDDKYEYALCEMFIRTYRSVLYAIAINRLNDYNRNK